MRVHPPYHFVATDGTVRGIYPEILTGAMSRLGCTVRFIEMPSPRALIELEAGRIDFFPGSAKTSERSVFAHFSGPLERHPNALYVSAVAYDKYALKRLDDIRGTDFRLGYQRKLSYGVEFDALISDPEFVARLALIATEKGAWQMMAAGRIDGLIADDETAMEDVRGLGLQDSIRKAKVALVPTQSYIALSKKSLDPAFRARFDVVIAEMTRSGELAQIFERNGRCPTVGSVKRCK